MESTYFLNSTEQKKSMPKPEVIGKIKKQKPNPGSQKKA